MTAFGFVRLALLLPLLLAGAGKAEEVAPKPGLAIELNGLATVAEGCRATFVISNGLEASITKATVEIALFDGSGLVDRMITLDLGSLPAGKTRVRQFRFASRACADISRLLVNDVVACEGGGSTPASCLAAMTATSRTTVPFGS